MSRLRPAIRIFFAPLANRRKPEMWVGETDKQARTIRLDPRVPHLGKTLLHEMLHVQHPDWGEDRVEAEEELRWSRMNWRDKARLYQLLGSAKLEGEA